MNKVIPIAGAIALAMLASTTAEAATRKKSAIKVTGVVNLNQATVAQLDLLPGVGEKAARKIAAHREKTPFRRIEELVNVKGFGKKRFDKLKPHLAVSGPTTIRAKKEGAPPVQARVSPALR
jgi:competence protein ComEA